jgi:hypothetical protein
MEAAVRPEVIEVRPHPAAASLLGIATLGLAAYAAGRQLGRSPTLAPAPAPRQRPDAATRKPARALHASAALLGLSVLLDSAMEHWRGDFENPGMVTPLVTSMMTIAAGASGAAKRDRDRRARMPAYATAVAAGMAGTGFHVYNVLRRPGGLSWMNLFYAAPLGAPAALSLSGLFGLAAQRLGRMRTVPRRFGRALAALTSIGIAGTAAEAGLLHFRGAFQNPFMWLPVSLPPLAALAMARAATGPRQRRYRAARGLLMATAALGIGGVGFHAYGVSRQMGGWSNARQNLLSGPPLPAPPAFSALALAGGAALSLLEKGGKR